MEKRPKSSPFHSPADLVSTNLHKVDVKSCKRAVNVIDLAIASRGIMTANGDPTNQVYLARVFQNSAIIC